MSTELIHNARINHISFGDINFTGALATDSYIEIAPNSDRYAASQDAGGYNETISKLSDQSATVTLQLQTQSSANAKLVRVMAQEDVDGIPVIANINIDTGGGTVFLYDLIGCYIMTRPTETKSADMSNTSNTWVFRCQELRPKNLENFNFNADIKASIENSVEATVSVSTSITL